MLSRVLSVLALLTPGLLGAQGVDPPPPGAARAAATITAGDIAARVGIIAHDSMRGRLTPSPGLDATADWMAAEMARLGLRPGGDDGGFLQRYAIETVALALGEEASALRWGRDLIPLLATALPPDEGIEGEVVILRGTGDVAAGLARTHLQGRVVLLAGPAGGGAAPYRATLGLAREALARGAAAVLVATDASDRSWRGAVADVEGRRWTRVGGAPGLPVFAVRDGSLEGVLPPGRWNPTDLRDARGLPLEARAVPGGAIRLGPRLRVMERRTAPNVVAILPGSDPDLRREHVVFSAHLDHVGVGSPDARGDSIYNGADDDASGTATVVELAEAFAALRPAPRRSLVFLGVSGEEGGLWGSDYFTTHPPMDLGDVVADLNIDMIGRNWRDTIVAIGREHSDLGATLDRVSALHPELGLAVIDDPWPQESFYTRSDHYNFARRGVPVLFFFSGTHEDYHRPGDEAAKIDAEKTARIGRLLFWLGLDIADRTERPRWDPDSRRRIVEGRGR